MKILITTPDISFSGGVAKHYSGLQNKWTCGHVGYYQFITGIQIKKYVKNKSLQKLLQYITKLYNFISFFIRLLFHPQIKVVVINPSFNSNAIKRDAIFLSISKLFNKKTIVFIHGWDDEYAKQIRKTPNMFINKYNKADGFFVLASQFRSQLIEFGITKDIYMTTTKVDDALIEDFDINSKTGQVKNILFLARVEKAKGVYTAINSFEILQKKYPDLSLTIVGTGSEFENVKKHIEKSNLKNVELTGNLRGDALINKYCQADIYLFPSHHEGMPTTVLEAMAFGLPIITRPVGGLVDFFEEEKMGYLINSHDAHDYVKAIELFMNNPNYTQQVSRYNHLYAIKHFKASKVAVQLENILNSFL